MGRINKTNKTTPVSADEFIIYDSQDTSDDKNITLGQIASFTESQDSTITGTKIFADGVELQKGSIAFGQYSPLPTGIGSYIAQYTHPTYGPRLLGYNGLAYQDLSIGSMPTAGTVSMKSLANGDCNFGYNTNITGNCTANKFYGDGSKLTGIVSGVSEFDNRGTVTTDITLAENKITTGYWSGTNSIILPTITDTTKQVTCILDFTTANAGYPNIVSINNLCWSSINNNAKPGSWNTDSLYRNRLEFKTIWKDGILYWEAEYKSYKERPSNAHIYGYYIDITDSNPATRVHYIEDNETFTSAHMNYSGDIFDYGDWADVFFIPTPVMLKYDGTEDYELDVNDYTKKVDGITPSDIANTSYGGNAMMRFPQIWTKRYTSGNYQYVLKSNIQIDDTWKAYSWYNKNNVLLDYCYMAIYQPTNISSKLRSLSGQTILTNAAGATEVAYATANGTSWYTGTFADWIEIQELLVLMGKSTDIQSIFGNGRSSAANSITGEANLKGQFYGTSGNGMLKIFGMENYYGNYWKRIAGCVYTSSGYKIKMTEGTQDGSTVTGYNSDGTGYIVPSVTTSGSSGGYISAAVQTAYGLLPSVASGSSSTYFCDGLWWTAGGYAVVGGCYDDGLLDGAFALYLYDAFSYAYTLIGASLSCRPL